MPDGLEPHPLAMILCDAVHIDPTTGKRTLLGLFSTLVSSEFPTVVRSMAVHVSLTECRRNLAVTLHVVDANEERGPIAIEEGDVQSDNPLDIVEFDLYLVDVEFPEPGEYRVQLYAEGALIIERRLSVIRQPGVEGNDG